MTTIIGVENLGDTTSEPHTIARSLFNQAAIIGPRGSVQNMVVWGNGSIDMVSAERGMPLVGRAQVPIALIFNTQKGVEGKSDYDIICDNLIEPTIDDLTRLYTENFELQTWTDKTVNPRQQKPVDVRIKTRPQVPRNKFIMYEDRNSMVIEVDKFFKRRIDDELQNNISDRILKIKQIPLIKPIGIGMLSKEWKNLKRPNNYFRIGPRTSLRLSFISKKYARAEWVAMTSYAYLAAAIIREWLGDKFIPAKEWTFEDTVAFTTVLIGFIAGYGSTDTTAHFEISDIEKQIAHFPGMGWSQSNRYLFGGEGNLQSFEDVRAYYIFLTVLGLAASRVKALVEPMNIMKHYYVNEYQIPSRMAEVFTPNIQQWGSDSQLFFPMQRNNFAYNGKMDSGIPCLLDMDSLNNLSDSEILEKANQYEVLEPQEMISFSPVRIEKGELPSGVVSDQDRTEKGIVLSASTDSRIYEFMLSDGMNQRTILGLKLPLHDIVINNMHRDDRVKLFMYSLLGNNEVRMKNGYIMDTSFGILSAVSVKYRRGSLDALVADKKDSDKKGEQVVTPGGMIAAGPTDVSQDTLRSTIVPPSPRPYDKELPKKVETQDGKTTEDKNVASPEGERKE